VTIKRGNPRCSKALSIYLVKVFQLSLMNSSTQYSFKMATLNTLTTVLAGALFGGALAASGMHLPSVIISQMQLRDFRMLKTFLTASASSV
jgi:hypothetical protein